MADAGVQRADLGLSALLAIQVVTLFVAIPLGPGHPSARTVPDALNLAFAAPCSAALSGGAALPTGPGMRTARLTS